MKVLKKGTCIEEDDRTVEERYLNDSDLHESFYYLRRLKIHRVVLKKIVKYCEV